MTTSKNKTNEQQITIDAARARATPLMRVISVNNDLPGLGRSGTVDALDKIWNVYKTKNNGCFQEE
jgi:hypothetical protein